MEVSFLVLLLISTASAARITYCKNSPSSASVDFKNIKITGCSPTKRDCIFKKGQDASMQLPFTPKETAHNITAIVHGVIVGVPIPFPLPNKNACKNSGLECPLTPKKKTVYTAELPVKKEYPSLRVTVRWELKDEQGHDIICINFPVRLQG